MHVLILMTLFSLHNMYNVHQYIATTGYTWMYLKASCNTYIYIVSLQNMYNVQHSIAITGYTWMYLVASCTIW